MPRMPKFMLGAVALKFVAAAVSGAAAGADAELFWRVTCQSKRAKEYPFGTAARIFVSIPSSCRIC